MALSEPLLLIHSLISFFALPVFDFIITVIKLGLDRSTDVSATNISENVAFAFKIATTSYAVTAASKAGANAPAGRRSTSNTA